MRYLLAILVTVAQLATAAVETQVFYRFGDDGYKYGFNLVDSSGHGRHIADTNGGFVDTSISFTNGVDGGIAYGFDLSPVLKGSWVPRYVPPASNVGVEISYRMTDPEWPAIHLFGTGNTNHGIRIVTGVGSIAGYVGTNKFAEVAAPAGWIRVAVVTVGGVTSFYTNCVFVGSTNLAPVACTGEVSVGGSVDTGFGLVGQLDEARIFTFVNFSTNDLLGATGVAPRLLGTIFSDQMQDGAEIKLPAGHTGSMRCAVSGATSYLWSNGSTNRVMSFTNSGTFRLIASNSQGSVTSAPVRVVAETLIEPDPATGASSFQQRMVDRRYGMFICWGLNTFLNLEWSNGQAPSVYTPSNVAEAVDGWIRMARDVGMTYVVFTAKHHDGFCLWNSSVTDYDVGSSPNTNDVVGILAKACSKYGIKLGLYYSMWDRHEPSYAQDINSYSKGFVQRQITELLTQYGPVCELWLDGMWVDSRKGVDWRIAELYDLVKRLQPDCMVGGNCNIGTSDTLDVGVVPSLMTNGLPVAYFPQDFRSYDTLAARIPDPKQYAAPFRTGSYYLPFEFAASVSSNGWWYFKTNDTHAKSFATVSNWYATAVSQTNVCLLNLPPAPSGGFAPAHTNVLYELRSVVPQPSRKITFKRN